MAKSKQSKSAVKKSSKRKRHRNTGSQTDQPFEQDPKRRIGPYGGTGKPPIMR